MDDIRVLLPVLGLVALRPRAPEECRYLFNVPLAPRAYEILAVTSLDELWPKVQRELGPAGLNPFLEPPPTTLVSLKTSCRKLGYADDDYQRLLLDLRCYSDFKLKHDNYFSDVGPPAGV